MTEHETIVLINNLMKFFWQKREISVLKTMKMLRRFKRIFWFHVQDPKNKTKKNLVN